MSISPVTRRKIIDEMVLEKFDWAGRLDEPDFLARLYDLTALPSTDRRFKDAYGDIYQHRVNNDDWPDDWVFSDPRLRLDQDDNAFLSFIAEMVHPIVRIDEDECAQIIEKVNRHLERDGWEISESGSISGHRIYAAREKLTVPLALDQVSAQVNPSDRASLSRQITRMRTSIETDPDLAIGTAKELIETCCFTILDTLGASYDRKWKITRLIKETNRHLKLAPDEVSEEARAAASVRQILGSLGQIVQGVAEIRNEFGTGHGRPLRSSGLSARHARLVVGAASTLASFLFETYDFHYGESDSGDGRSGR